MAMNPQRSIFNFPPPISADYPSHQNHHNLMQLFMSPRVVPTPPPTPFSGKSYHLFYSGVAGQWHILDGSLATPHNSPFSPQIHSALLPTYSLVSVFMNFGQLKYEQNIEYSNNR